MADTRETETGLGTLRHRHLSIPEAVAEAQDPARHRDGDSSRSMDDGWSGCSMDEALRMAVEGYPQGTARLVRQPGLHARIRRARRPAPRWDTAGSAVDVGRFLTSEPSCMIEIVRTQRQAPVLKLNVERAVSANVPASDILAVGAGVLSAVEAFRTAGIPAEVWATFTQQSQRSGTQTYALSVLIQSAGRAVDLDILAFWLMHPAALRRIAFAVEETEADSYRRALGFTPGGGYGYPTTLERVGSPDVYDETAPANAYAVTPWLIDILGRRAGILIERGDLT